MEDLSQMLLSCLIAVPLIFIGFKFLEKDLRKQIKKLSEENIELKSKNHSLKCQNSYNAEHIGALRDAVDIEYEKQQNDLW